MTPKRHAVGAPRCVIIAGPNGAGKTTFAREFLPKDTDIVHFVNADLIAAGLSALRGDRRRNGGTGVPGRAGPTGTHANELCFRDHVEWAGPRRALAAVEGSRLSDRDCLSSCRLDGIGIEAHCLAGQAGWTQRAEGGRDPALWPELVQLFAHLPTSGRRLVGVR